ncbi:hypothetical protein ETB97_009118 [Aspergillus alliaceus]|uniref:Uncharacterized protein n=1 Tax=Petromyces alliaceus TaxID=209559 RepID=A0A8H6E1R2_PETAA|nr:hypothetical protein ETB97_009118 [Aspergillus burnettii]
MLYFESWKQGHIAALPEELMSFQIPITLFQSLIRTLLTQNQDGSWGSSSSAEETAYAVLILKNVACLSFTALISSEVQCAIDRGQHFILSKSERSGMDDQLWLDKTLYAIPTVSDSYIQAAMKTYNRFDDLKNIIRELLNLPYTRIHKLTEYFEQLPSVMKASRWVVQASVIEAFLFKYNLRTLDHSSQRAVLGEKYLDYTAFFWVFANNSRADHLLSTSRIYNMVEFAAGIYQEDHYMDTCLLELPDTALNIIANFADRVCSQRDGSQTDNDNRSLPEQDSADLTEEIKFNIKQAEQLLERWMKSILNNSCIENASEYDRRNLRKELKVAVAANFQQAKSNIQLRW